MLHHARSCIFSNARVSYSTSSIFGDAGAAGFVAGAWSSSSIPTLRGLPEVIVTGRANSGKSTLLNAVLGRKALVHTSKKAGRTRQLNFFRVGPEPGKLLLVDAPGYGARGRVEWGEIFNKYLEARKELRRVYILFNAKHKLHSFDTQMLTHISSLLVNDRGIQPFTLQAVITKADTVPTAQLEDVITTLRREIFDAAPLCLPPIITSAHMSPPFGIDALRKSIAEACGLR